MSRRFGQLCFLAIVTPLAVLFLIWVGGMVRATGAGMAARAGRRRLRSSGLQWLAGCNGH